ncbi:hypothetical protein AB5J62_31570 [Amycolatopsis sp. cg5]|uniref:hypothetical protein n=1 Tax=Amycolatopsis sp. cg5 TaxID=3238802 RepID=UPI0035237936
MGKFFKRGAVVAVTAASIAVIAPQVALAGGQSATCQGTVCYLSVAGYKGGGLSIDADVHGQGTGHWIVCSWDGKWCAEKDFDASAGPGSWLESWARQDANGGFDAKVTGPQGPVTIGLRWLDKPRG